MAGPNSLLLLSGDRHRSGRQVIWPPFHGARMCACSQWMCDAALREFRRWRPGEELVIQERMQRIPLEVILRAVFGAQNEERVAAYRDLVRAGPAEVNPLPLHPSLPRARVRGPRPGSARHPWSHRRSAAARPPRLLPCPPSAGPATGGALPFAERPDPPAPPRGMPERSRRRRRSRAMDDGGEPIPLAPEEARLLDEVLDAVVPPSEDGRLPGAGALGTAATLRRRASGDAALRATLQQGLAVLASRLGQRGLSALPPAERIATLESLGSDVPGFLPSIVFHAYTAYYQHPRVLDGLGLPGRPPFPEGYDLEPGDLAGLAKVRARGRLYREV